MPPVRNRRRTLADNDVTIDVLRRRCEEKGLSTTGRKATLISRLQQHASKNTNPGTSTRSTVEQNEPGLLNDAQLSQIQSIVSRSIEQAMSEIATNAARAAVHRTLRDVLLTPSVNPASMTIRIKESKTDPFRIGQSITVGACNSPLCPVLAMKRYLSTRKIDNGPLFVHSSGKPLTKQLLTSETGSLLQKSGFNAAHYAGHGYRIGAATTAAAAKLPSWLIKTLGRWTSDCYERYIKIPPVTIWGISHSNK